MGKENNSVFRGVPVVQGDMSLVGLAFVDSVTFINGDAGERLVMIDNDIKMASLTSLAFEGEDVDLLTVGGVLGAFCTNEDEAAVHFSSFLSNFL